MRKELYKAIIEAVSEVEEIRHIDLWNKNVEYIEVDEPFPMPAVFVEFTPVNWQRLAGPVQEWKGTGNVNLHIVTQWHGSAAAGSDEMEENLAAFDLAEKIHNALEGITGTNYRDMSLVQTQTNHNHEEIFENIEIYKVHYKRYLNEE